MTTQIRVLLCIALCMLFLQQCDSVNQLEKYNYPTEIPEYRVRKDSHTNETVTRGRLHHIDCKVSQGRFSSNKGKLVSLKDFQRHLQCAPPAVEMDGNRGGWSMLQLAPPRKQTVEQVCAWAESKCEPWLKCRNVVRSYKNGTYRQGKAVDVFNEVWGEFRGPALLRVINNELHLDWPWGIERFSDNKRHYEKLRATDYALFEMVLRLVSDIGDSVFFFGSERPFLKWNVPFPAFTFAPSIYTAEFPFPWYESYDQELKLYAQAEQHNDFTDAFYQKGQQPWQKRIPKAAFFGAFYGHSQIVFDSAVRRPDLFDVGFTATDEDIVAWNPESDEANLKLTEPSIPLSELIPAGDSQLPLSQQFERYTAGYVKAAVQFLMLGEAAASPHKYKYVIVPSGKEDLTSSSRLAGLLAHSGAVVLLQKSEFAYHFSARLEPWVHYVPLSHTMADVIDKIEWLNRNDHLAQRIVRNAQNFARSYLRLEDYLCYAAGSLRLLHDLEKTTDVLEGFSPVKI